MIHFQSGYPSKLLDAISLVFCFCTCVLFPVVLYAIAVFVADISFVVVCS